MLNSHNQSIRLKKSFNRDGPHVHKIDISKIISSRKMWPGQCESAESKKLDGDNRIYILKDFLNPSERIQYIQESYRHEKSPSVDGGCHNKLEFTRNGKPYTFSPQSHKTLHFKKHIQDISKKILETIKTKESFGLNLMDSATEYEYGVDISNGGSLLSTQDTEGDWNHVAFYALGQTRYLRITKKNARGFINIPLKDNSLVICSGNNFHTNYFHQIDDVTEEIALGTSLLLKTRFRKPLLSGTKTI